MKNMFQIMREHANDDVNTINDNASMSALYAYIWVFLIIPVTVASLITHSLLGQYKDAVDAAVGGILFTAFTYGAHRYLAWEAYKQEVSSLASAWSDSFTDKLKK